MRGGPLGVTKDAAHGFAAEAEAFVLDELLPEMRIVEAGIFAARQFEHPLTELRGHGPGFGLTAVAVPHPSDGIGLEAAFEPLHLAFAALFQSLAFAEALSDSTSPSLEGDTLSLQLWGDIILERLQC